MNDKFTAPMQEILKMVVKHQEFLSKNPKQLALLMDEFSNLHASSRLHKNEDLHDWNNPKDDILELKYSNIVDKEYADLVYDAWCAEMHWDRTPVRPLERKKNKSMDDIIAMCLDKDYKYHMIYPNRQQVLNYYLCVIGTGLDWLPDGSIGTTGPAGVDMNKFEFYWEETLDPSLLQEFIWINDVEINECKEKRKKPLKTRLKKIRKKMS